MHVDDVDDVKVYSGGLKTRRFPEKLRPEASESAIQSSATIEEDDEPDAHVSVDVEVARINRVAEALGLRPLGLDKVRTFSEAYLTAEDGTW